MTQEMLLTALLIFVLRIFNTGIGTVRVIIVNRGQRLLSSVMAFIEALLFAYTISTVATDLTNILNLAAYCLGFSAGNYLGMIIEARFFLSYVTVNIITRLKGREIADALRAAGFGVTESTGEGREGRVTILRSVLDNRDIPRLLTVVQQTHSEAFVAAEPARPLYRGWLGSGRIQL